MTRQAITTQEANIGAPRQPSHISVRETPPRISVVIPTYQEERRIATALACVLDQDVDERFEVLVVDSSSDRTAEIVARDFPGVRLIRSAHRLSAGAARNRGVAAARGAKLLFTDADVRVPHDWVRRLAAHLDEVQFAGGAVGNGTPESLPGTTLHWLEFFRLLPGRAPRTYRDARYVATANVGYCREVLKGHSFVDASVGEDIVLHHELIDSGARSRFDPELTVRHLNPASWRDVFAKQLQLGAGGSRWRLLGGVGQSLGVRFPLLMAAKPFAVVGVLLVGSLASRRWKRAAGVALLWPLLAAVDLAWVAAYVRAVRVSHRSRPMPSLAQPSADSVGSGIDPCTPKLKTVSGYNGL